MRREAEFAGTPPAWSSRGADQTGLLGAKRAVVHVEKHQRVSAVTPTRTENSGDDPVG